jgi:hypothetical protein
MRCCTPSQPVAIRRNPFVSIYVYTCQVSSYPENEFRYFLPGSVKLTSADGTVLALKAGEAMALPKIRLVTFVKNRYSSAVAPGLPCPSCRRMRMWS